MQLAVNKNDQEIEKLYSIQAEQFMNSGDHVDAMNITLLNSDVPKLENTENILLLPTKNPERIENSRSVSEEKKVKNSRKRKLFSFFKNINSRFLSDASTRPASNDNISKPFGFQHISHAGSKESATLEPEVTILPSVEVPKERKTLSKAFVTDSIPLKQDAEHMLFNELERTPASRRIRASSSISPNSSVFDRIVSTTSTAPTTSDSPPGSPLLQHVQRKPRHNRVACLPPTLTSPNDISSELLREAPMVPPIIFPKNEKIFTRTQPTIEEEWLNEPPNDTSLYYEQFTSRPAPLTYRDSFF